VIEIILQNFSGYISSDDIESGSLVETHIFPGLPCKCDMNRLGALVSCFVVALFLIGGIASMQAFASSSSNAPNVTYFVARWGLCTDCNRPGFYHRTAPDGSYGFNYYQAGNFAMYQQIEQNGSVYSLLSNFNGQKGLKLGYVTYNIGTPNTINTISISGSGSYYVKIWFDSNGDGEYGTWSSEGLRTSMGSDSYGIVQGSSPQKISSNTQILMTIVDGMKCSKVMSNCMVTYGQIQQGQVKDLTASTEMALNIQLTETNTVGSVWMMINSVSFS
jgi:hypothetical protein